MADNANIIQAVVRGFVQGQDYRNVLHFGTDAGVNDADYSAILAALGLAIMQCFTEVLLPELPSTCGVDHVGCKRIFPALTDEVLNATGAGVGGTATAGLPSFVATKMEIRTGGGGRRNRGRIYLFPPTEADTTDSFLAQAGNDLFAAFITCLAGKFIGAGATTPYRLGVLSRKSISEGQTIQQAWKPATSLTVSNTLAIMGRRKQGVGS